MVNDPFEGGAIAEAVIISLRRDAAEREPIVVEEGGLVFAEAHFFHAPTYGFSSFLCLLELVLELLLVVDVNFAEALAGFGEGVKHSGGTLGGA